MFVKVDVQRAYYGALGLVGSHEDALDLSQEAFVRAYNARDSIDSDRPFYTWYYQILRRLCFNLGRDKNTRRNLLDEANSWLVAQAEKRGPQQPHEHNELVELQQQTRSAIESLPDAEREIIVMRELQEMKYKEISETLGIPIGTVMSRLYAARKKLAIVLVDVR